MPSTKAEIRDRVLQKLGVLAAAEEAEAEDAALVETVIDAVHAEFDEEGLVSWPLSAVPDKLAESFATLIAARLVVEGSDFGAEPATVAKLAAAAPQAEKRFRRMVASGWSGEPTTTEYF